MLVVAYGTYGSDEASLVHKKLLVAHDHSKLEGWTFLTLVNVLIPASKEGEEGGGSGTAVVL